MKKKQLGSLLLSFTLLTGTASCSNNILPETRSSVNDINNNDMNINYNNQSSSLKIKLSKNFTVKSFSEELKDLSSITFRVKDSSGTEQIKTTHSEYDDISFENLKAGEAIIATDLNYTNSNRESSDTKVFLKKGVNLVNLKIGYTHQGVELVIVPSFEETEQDVNIIDATTNNSNVNEVTPFEPPAGFHDDFVPVEPIPSEIPNNDLVSFPADPLPSDFPGFFEGDNNDLSVIEKAPILGNVSNNFALPNYIDGLDQQVPVQVSGTITGSFKTFSINNLGDANAFFKKVDQNTTSFESTINLPLGANKLKFTVSSDFGADTKEINMTIPTRNNFIQTFSSFNNTQYDDTVLKSVLSADLVNKNLVVTIAKQDGSALSSGGRAILEINGENRQTFYASGQNEIVIKMPVSSFKKGGIKYNINASLYPDNLIGGVMRASDPKNPLSFIYY